MDVAHRQSLEAVEGGLDALIEKRHARRTKEERVGALNIFNVYYKPLTSPTL